MKKDSAPKFRDPATMTEEELTDPDKRLKNLAEQRKDKGMIARVRCSRCHHCRR